MAGTKEIKRRIKSVKNTKKITKAMELVAASKMKRAVTSTLASRMYAEYSWEVLTSISNSIEEITSPLFIKRESKENEKKNILLILITSNRGLCGAYNAQVIKKALSLLKNDNLNVDFVTIGKKGDHTMRHLGVKIVASFTEFPDQASLEDIFPVAKLAIEEYSFGNYDQIFVTYTDFISALVQKPNVKQILPISKTDIKELMESIEKISGKNLETKPKDEKKVNYLFEGDISSLIGSIAEKLVWMQIYQMFLESNTSEQSSRMVAMKNASDASGEMIDDLTLVFNKARQANITREISEISAGMASVE